MGRLSQYQRTSLSPNLGGFFDRAFPTSAGFATNPQNRKLRCRRYSVVKKHVQATADRLSPFRPILAPYPLYLPGR